MKFYTDEKNKQAVSGQGQPGEIQRHLLCKGQERWWKASRVLLHGWSRSLVGQFWHGSHCSSLGQLWLFQEINRNNTKPQVFARQAFLLITFVQQLKWQTPVRVNWISFQMFPFASKVKSTLITGIRLSKQSFSTNSWNAWWRREERREMETDWGSCFADSE